MKQVIYVDILLSVNLFINYFVLLAASRFLKLPIKRRRIFYGALLGAAYSLYIFVPVKSPLLSVPIKLLMAATLVLLSFGPNSLRLFWKELACFFSINFAFAGLMFALWYFAAPPGLSMNNGVVYFDISPLLLIGMTLFCYLVIRIIHRLTGREQPKGDTCEVTITLGEREAVLHAKVDTGNELKEPFSGLPVVVTDNKGVAQLLPEALRPLFETSGAGLPQDAFPDAAASGVSCRMIPCRTASGEGVLPAFRPDRVVVRQGDAVHEKKAYVAVSGPLSAQKEFSTLVGTELL